MTRNKTCRYHNTYTYLE